MWIPELGLRKFDKEVLQSETGWLNDNIVDAAQILLKKVCPIQGLQKVSLGLTLIFGVQRGEFIQILNTGAGHWVTISTIGTDHPVVNIYDSVYSTACDELQQQIASILITQHSSIILHFIDVQLQSGSSDCGLFAIAYATALVFGEMPQNFVSTKRKCGVIYLNAWKIKI